MPAPESSCGAHRFCFLSLFIDIMAHLHRKKTITLHFDPKEGGRPPAWDIYQCVLSLGLIREDLEAVEEEFGSHRVHLKVKEASTSLDEYSELLKVRDRKLRCEDGSERTVRATLSDQQVTTVRIRNLPLEVSDDKVREDLEEYGYVFEMKEEVYGASHPFARLKTGVRIVFMEIYVPIPNFIEIAGCQVYAEYFGQPRTCSICASTKHMRAKCPERGGRRREEQERESVVEEIWSEDSYAAPERPRASSEPPPTLPPLLDVTPPAASTPAAADAPAADAEQQHPSTPPRDVSQPEAAAQPTEPAQQPSDVTPQQHPVSVQTTEEGGEGVEEEEREEGVYSKAWEKVKEQAAMKKRQASESPESPTWKEKTRNGKKGRKKEKK